MPRITLLILMSLIAAWIISLGSAGVSVHTPPARRMSELINNSEDFGFPISDKPIWFTEVPTHMVVDRVHGGITPGHGSLPVP